MILGWIEGLGVWTWFIAGLVLLGVEILTPGNVFVWLGIAALIVGVAALLGDFSWQVEVIAFAALSLVLVVGGRRYFARRAAAGEEPLLNRRADRLIGQNHILRDPIVDGSGRVRIADTNWRVRGPDLPSGTRVTVIGHDGGVLMVRAAD